MKIAVVGGGSTYSPELLHGLAEAQAALGLERVALTDIDDTRLGVVGGFARRMCHVIAPALSIECCGLEEALSEASFVVVQIRVGGQTARLAGERLGRDNGVIGQETTGVGGLAKALVTVPEMLKIAKTAERVAPSATLINFTNPVAIVTEALLNHSSMRTIGLCNIPISQRMEIAAQLGVAATDVEIDSVGLNHLSFIRGVKVKGEEVLPTLIADVAKLLNSGHKPANIPDLDFPADLLESLGMIPSDYLRYYYLQRETVAEQRAQEQLRAEQVMAVEEELLGYYADEKNVERPDALMKRGGAFYSHAAIEIISAMTNNTGERLIVDVMNEGTVPELPPSASIEVPCIVDQSGAKPLPQKPLEPAIRGLIQHVKSYEQLAIEAALSKKRSDIYLALVAHPLTPSAELASQLANDLAR